MRTLAIPESLRAEIARAILEDEGNANGEHLFDGERVIFYCPMQGHGLPKDLRALVPVRGLLPAGMRVPAFVDYLAAVRPGAEPPALDRDERAALQSAYEEDAVARLASALLEQVTLR